MFAAILITGALGAAPAVIPDGVGQFNLVCSGRARTVAGPKIPDEWARTFSVDLAAGHWCDRSDGCAQVKPVAGVAGDRVVLEHAETHERVTTVEVLRSNGAVALSFDLGDKAAYLLTGKCTLAPFEPIDPATPAPGE